MLAVNRVISKKNSKHSKFYLIKIELKSNASYIYFYRGFKIYREPHFKSEIEKEEKEKEDAIAAEEAAEAAEEADDGG
mgnify:CR=1 FL=1